MNRQSTIGNAFSKLNNFAGKDQSLLPLLNYISLVKGSEHYVYYAKAKEILDKNDYSCKDYTTYIKLISDIIYV